MKSSSPPLANRQALLDQAASSGLFTPAQRTRADALLPPEIATAPRAAQHLVNAGLLTRFQAERLLAGRTDGFVLGQYVIEDQIGRGSSGRVYRAKHRTMNRPVAIKVLDPGLTRRPSARQAFHEGVRAAARLNHPNIVTTYDANEIGDRFYLVLEFVDGPSLQTQVELRGPLPVAEACEWIRQVAQALAHAHDQGMPHRNLTPGSVLVSHPPKSSSGGIVKVTNFGLSELLAHEPTPSLEQTPIPLTLVGQLHYTAPETIASPASADFRADLYSLGAIFHFLLTARPPNADGAGPTLPHEVPPVVAETVRSLLSYDPNARVPAVVVAERLTAFSFSPAVPHEDRTAVNFDLPHHPARPDNLTGGYLTGIPEPELSPWADIVTPSYEKDMDTVASDPRGSTAVTLPAVKNSEDKPHGPKPTNESKGISPAVLLVMAASMVTLCLLAIGAVIRYASK